LLLSGVIGAIGLAIVALLVSCRDDGVKRVWIWLLRQPAERIHEVFRLILPRSRRMYRKNLRVLIAAGLLLAYPAIAWGHWLLVAAELLPDRRAELFPFAPWTMFGSVPNQSQHFELSVQQADGQFAPLLHVQSVFGARQYQISLRTYGIIQRLGAAMATGDSHEIAAAESSLRTALGVEFVGERLRLSRVEFDPLQRWSQSTSLSSECVYELSFPVHSTSSLPKHRKDAGDQSPHSAGDSP
jgi:hypothetical protein